MIATVILAVFLVLWVGGILLSVMLERRDFNGGVCRRCGKALRHFDDDTRGGEGWVCDECGAVVWIEWISTGTERVRYSECRKEQEDGRGDSSLRSE